MTLRPWRTGHAAKSNFQFSRMTTSSLLPPSKVDWADWSDTIRSRGSKQTESLKWKVNLDLSSKAMDRSKMK